MIGHGITMDNNLPDHINDRRRRNLIRYTLLAMLSYQLPVGVFYLARVLNIGKYSYVSIHIGYVSFLICSLMALMFIRLKKQITKEFILFTLHFQVVMCMIVAFYMIYVMGNQRYLVPIACLCILMFVFIQSSLLVSFIAIFFVVFVYLSASFAGIIYGGQPGSLVSESLYILIFVPVCVFIAYLSKRMQDQQKAIKCTNKTLKTAHEELEVTHAKLESIHEELGVTHAKLEFTHEELEINNKRMIENIRYAEMIQRSLLPDVERIKAVSSDNMLIWLPKDIVGGDTFFIHADVKGSVIALMDCTGHGVPGAFLTIIAYSEIRNIIMYEACHDPAEILKRLNKAVKNVLHKNNDGNRTNDGLDAAVCHIDHASSIVTYSGARIPIFFVKEGKCHKINGCRQSIGYKDSSDDFIFTNHVIDAVDCCPFYLITDGFTDQMGGAGRFRFGTPRFMEMLVAQCDKSFKEQKKDFLKTLQNFKGETEQIDDITLIGFKL